MDDLIEALTIFKKYANDYQRRRPTACEHDTLYIAIPFEQVSAEDLARLETLGFSPDEDSGNFYSYRFGSC